MYRGIDPQSNLVIQIRVQIKFFSFSSFQLAA